MEGVTKIKDLTPESRSVNILAKVLSKSEPKAIQTKFGEEKSVTEVYIGDDTGKVILSLWGDQAAQTSDGQVVSAGHGCYTPFNFPSLERIHDFCRLQGGRPVAGRLGPQGNPHR